MNSAIIVAGGSGTRMNSQIPKQFLRLQGIPVLMHSLLAFHLFDPSIRLLVALPEHLFETWYELQKHHEITISHQLVAGGETRFHSVSNCLKHLGMEGLVGIHDGARPLVSPDLIRRLYATAGNEGNAIPVIPIGDSIRMKEGLSTKPVDRSLFQFVQTPQIFLTSLLQQAYSQPYQPGFTDDATVFESAGNPIHLVPGDPINLKITYPHDLAIAEALITSVR